VGASESVSVSAERCGAESSWGSRAAPPITRSPAPGRPPDRRDRGPAPSRAGTAGRRDRRPRARRPRRA
jgi:hypothetical protein